MKCSVCGREIGDESYIQGNNCYICSNCCASIGSWWAKSIGIEIYDPDEDQVDQEINVMLPSQIKEFLDQYVIGQDDAKVRLAVAVYNHYKRLKYKKESDVEIQKSNVLLLGPTASGKTLLAQTISKMLNVPIAIVDATSLTEAGYVGEDVESIITKLLQAADYDVSLAEKGIIFIDEFDKIARKGGANPSITRDVSGEGVQQALLKIIEGTVVGVAPKGGRKHPDQDLVEVDTKNILFICAGAFEGIEQRISQRLDMNKVGYANIISKDKANDGKSLLSRVTPEDLRNFGLIPEIIGRLPVITHTEELTKEQLLSALTEPKNSLVKQYEELMKIDNIKLRFDKAALEKIVERTMQLKTGARGLRSVMEQVMYESMFKLPGSGKKSFTVTSKLVDERLNAAA